MRARVTPSLIVEFAACWLLPLALGALILRAQVHQGQFGLDFSGSLWQPGRDILHGHSPYLPPTLKALAAPAAFIYPPIGALPGIPFALLPLGVAEVLWAVVLAGSVVAALLVLRVRDWRCFGFALLTFPVFEGLGLGNLSMLYVLGLAIVWRWRDDPKIAAPVLGLMVAMKLFLWPLFLWMIVTRRTRTALLAAGIAVAAIALSWAVIGFEGLRQYPDLLRVATDWRRPGSYSLFTLGAGLGMPVTAATWMQNLVGLGVLAVGVLVSRGADGDRRSFSGLLTAALVLSPIIWAHYLSMLIVPLALRRPSMSRLWFLPTALWLCALVPNYVAAPLSSFGVSAPSSIVVWQRTPERVGLGLLVIAAAFVATTVAKDRRAVREPAYLGLEAELA